MHSNIAVGAAGFLFAALAVDQPTIQWLTANWQTLVLVTVATMLVASVTCLLSPAPSRRQTIGRILASGIFGMIISVITGSLLASGDGPAATVTIILLCGIGGWMVWLTIIEYVMAIKETPGAKEAILKAGWNVILRIFNIPRTPTTQEHSGQDVIKLPPAQPISPPPSPRVETDANNPPNSTNPKSP